MLGAENQPFPEEYSNGAWSNLIHSFKCYSQMEKAAKIMEALPTI
jgi:hypothetical protein